MVRVHPKSLVRWAFLSAVFIIFSLAVALSEEGNYLLCFLNTYPEGDIYYTVGQDLPAVHLVLSFNGEYLCARVSKDYISTDADFHIAIKGESPLGKTKVLPAFVELVHEDNNVYVLRTAYVDVEKNIAYIIYSAEGTGYATVREIISKSVAADSDQISGDVIFEEPDPVILIHLRVERGHPSFARFLITSYETNSPPLFPRDVSFSACSLRVVDLSLERVEISGQEMISGHFKLLDGDRPVYVTQISVSVGDEMITPQFSPEDRMYSFLVPIKENAERIVITAEAPNCSRLFHEVPIPPKREKISWYLILAIILILSALLMFYYLRYR